MLKINPKKPMVLDERNYSEEFGFYSGNFGEINLKRSGNNLIYLECEDTCREDFHEYYFNTRDKNTHFLFNHGGGNFSKLIACVRAIEIRLKIPKTQFIKFYPIKDRNNICLIVISKWWMVNMLRLQFLTILLRAGINYNTKGRAKDPIWAAFNTQLYFSRTRTAVNYFLAGHTKISKKYKNYLIEEGYGDPGREPGWYKNFHSERCDGTFLFKDILVK